MMARTRLEAPTQLFATSLSRNGIAGFTVVELLTALAVLATLAVMAVPAFRELAASQRVQTAAQDLQTSLLRARSEAIRTKANVTLSPVGSWTGGWAIVAMRGDPPAPEDIDTRSATPFISISGPADVEYRSNGRVAGATIPEFSIYAGGTTLRRCVRVSLSGQPMVTKVACS